MKTVKGKRIGNVLYQFIFKISVFVLLSTGCCRFASGEQDANVTNTETNATTLFNLTQTKGINYTQTLKINKLNLSIYYETLCPFSIDFIRNQLRPVWNKLGDKYLDLKFIPYGNGHTFFKPGMVMTGCQHGEWECSGNKMHACALEYLTREQSTAFIFCSMSKDFPPDAADTCIKELRIPLADFDLVKGCFSSIGGDLALALKGLMSLDFLINGVPALAINGILVESDEIYENLLLYVCEEFNNINEKLDKKSVVPSECIGHELQTSNMASIHLENATSITVNESIHSNSSKPLE